MNVWMLTFSYQAEDEDDGALRNAQSAIGVYSSIELAHKAAARSVTGKPIKWFTSEAHGFSVGSFPENESWYCGNVLTFAHIKRFALDAETVLDSYIAAEQPAETN